MPRLLDRMPFPAESGEVVVRRERVRVRANQIIVWVSLSLRPVTEQSPAVVPFPAILDTGNNHSFAVSERHLVEWAGLRPDALDVRGTIRERGQRIPLRVANLWVHPNEPGRQDQVADVSPVLLETEAGIVVYPAGEYPRLPLLGLRVIGENNLVLKLDGPRREATLRIVSH